MKKRNLLLMLAAVMFSSCYISVPFQGLARGRNAPALKVEEWLNATQPVELNAPRSRPILLEFWSSDCPPCVAEIPRIKAIRQAYGDALETISVHVSLKPEPAQDRAPIEAFLRKHAITYPVGIDQSGKQWKNYEFSHLPHAVILDENLQVRWSGNLLLYDLEHALRKTIGKPEQTVELPAALREQKVVCEDGVCRAPN